MRHHRLVLPAILSCILSAALSGAATEPILDAGPGDLLFGGCGGAYLLAEPGELVIEVLKRDRKRPGKPWEPPRILVVAPFSEYSVFYHRLTIDRAGRLLLSYDYWSTYWFYRLDHYGRRRALLMSPDGGDSWRLAEGL